MEWTPGTPLPFETAENFRELGGWPAAEGRRVKRGLLWRSGALCHISGKEECGRFEALGIRVVCDLRSGVERARQPDPEFAGVRRHDIGAIRDAGGEELPIDANNSLHLDADGLRALAREMETIYSALPFNNPAYREIFREMLAGELPLLFHCSAGKDRTGVAAALILLALGASRETVMQDFLATNDCRPGAVRECLEVYRGELEREPELRPILESVSGVRPESMQAVFDAIDRRYACMEDFFAVEYGMGPEQLCQLRDRCLE